MYFKTLREPLIEQQEKRDEKRDKLIEQLKDSQERIVQAIEYDPQKALTSEGKSLPEVHWDPCRKYAFIDTMRRRIQRIQMRRRKSMRVPRKNQVQVKPLKNWYYKT